MSSTEKPRSRSVSPEKCGRGHNWPLLEAEVERRAELFNALGNKIRLKILGLLLRREMPVCEIVESLGSAASTVAHHLRTLERAGLVASRRQGKFTYYTIQGEDLAKHHVFDFLDTRSDDDLHQGITERVSGTTMPTYGDKLTLDEIADIIAFFRNWQR